MVGKIISASVIVPIWTGTKQKRIVNASINDSRVIFFIEDSLLLFISNLESFVFYDYKRKNGRCQT